MRNRPKTIEETAEILKQILSDENKESVKAISSENDLIKIDLTLGRAIRNEFGLWKENDELINSCGANNQVEASIKIIKLLQEKLRNSNNT